MVLSLLISVLGAAPVLPEHAVGGVFVSRETKTELELTLRFDQSVVKDAPALPTGKMNCDEPEKKGPQWSVELERETKRTSLRCCGP